MVKHPSVFGEKSAISIIKRDVLECNLPFRGDTYDGCYHNCVYCYARWQKEFRKIWYSENPRPADISDLKRRFELGFRFKGRGRGGDTFYVNRAIRHRFPIRLGTQTDCFQPCERKYRVTLQLMEFLVENGYPFMINTKSDLIEEDAYVDLMRKASFGNVVVQFTVTSLDSAIEKIEQRAPSPLRRFHAMKVLSDAGIPTQLRYSPVIPTLDYDAEEVFRQAKECGASEVITEYLRLSTDAEKQLDDMGMNGIVEAFRENGYFSKSYRRLNRSFRLRRYRELQKLASRLGLNLYVCSEEDPSINRCENCCGTDRYQGFQMHNTAAVNNIYRLLLRKGRVKLEDVKKSLWNIHWKEAEKRWNKGELEGCLIDTEVERINGQEVRDSDGNLVYIYKG